MEVLELDSKDEIVDTFSKTESQPLYVVLGANGRIGKLISTSLLSRGHRVVLVVKNKESLYELIEECLVNRVEKVLEVNLSESFNAVEKQLSNLIFMSNRFIVIDTLEFRHKNMNDGGYENILKAHLNIINFFKQYKNKISKFVLQSSNYVAFPFKFASFCINLHYDDLLRYRQLTELAVRSSELDYLIIRSGKILNSKENKIVDKFLKKVLVSQNISMSKTSITDVSLAKFIIDTLHDSTLPSSTSFECYNFIGLASVDFDKSVENQNLEESESIIADATNYEYQELKTIGIKQDIHANYSTTSHSVAKLIYKFVLLGTLSAMAYGCFSLIKRLIS